MPRQPLAPAQRNIFLDAAYRVYNSIGPDSGWTERTPTKAVFFDVICDQMAGPHSGLTRADLDIWYSLSWAEKRRIILEVGP